VFAFDTSNTRSGDFDLAPILAVTSLVTSPPSLSLLTNSLQQDTNGFTIAANPRAGALDKEAVQDTASGLSLVHFG
jgi:hypothetical protein